MQTLKKLICAKLGIDWISAPLSYSQTFCAVKTSGSTTGVYSYTTPARSSFQVLQNFPMMLLFRLRRPMHAPWLFLSVCLWNRTC